MKKVLALLLALAMVFAMAACGKTETPAPAAEPAAEPAATYQFGMGVYAESVTITEATADADAKVQVNPTVAVILVDADGKIADCKLDVAQSTAFVDANGVVLDKEQAYKTKLEKQDEYGMQKASGLEKGEWYQQAEFFCNYVVGKTASEVAGIKLDESFYPADEDLRAGCTIHVTDFMKAIADAFTRLEDAGEAASITLGVITKLDGSKDLTAEADGQVFFETCFGAAALAADGTANAVQLDCTQLKFPVTEGGVIGETSNVLSKIQLKENYGMQKASSLTEGEWFQQAGYLCSKLVGLDKAGIQAVALDDTTKPTDADILAGCTMKIGCYLDALVKGL